MNKSLDEENENILKNSNITNNIEEIIKTKQMSYYNSYLLEIKNEYNQFDKKNNIEINYNFSITTNEEDEEYEEYEQDEKNDENTFGNTSFIDYSSLNNNVLKQKEIEMESHNQIKLNNSWLDSFNDLFGINLFINDLLYKEMQINHKLGKIIYNNNGKIEIAYHSKITPKIIYNNKIYGTHMEWINKCFKNQKIV